MKWLVRQIALSLVALAACVLAVGLLGRELHRHRAEPADGQRGRRLASAPSASASVIAKPQGGTAGYVTLESATYYVYANVADSGNPASGIASVKANVSNVTSGQTAVALVAGSYTVDGVSYNYRSVPADSRAQPQRRLQGLHARPRRLGRQRRQPGLLGHASRRPLYRRADFETDQRLWRHRRQAGERRHRQLRLQQACPTRTRSSPAGTAAAPSRSPSRFSDSASNDTLTVSGATIGTRRAERQLHPGHDHLHRVEHVAERLDA